MILDTVDALTQKVIFEVEDLEAGEDVLDKSGDADGEVRVAEGDGVGGETAEFLGQIDEGEEVLLDGEVEGVAVLEVDGD